MTLEVTLIFDETYLTLLVYIRNKLQPIQSGEM